MRAFHPHPNDIAPPLHTPRVPEAMQHGEDSDPTYQPCPHQRWPPTMLLHAQHILSLLHKAERSIHPNQHHSHLLLLQSFASPAQHHSSSLPQSMRPSFSFPTWPLYYSHRVYSPIHITKI